MTTFNVLTAEGKLLTVNAPSYLLVMEAIADSGAEYKLPGAGITDRMADFVLPADMEELRDALAASVLNVADPVGSVIAEDMAAQDRPLRFKQGVNADGGVTLTKVQQVGQYTGLHMALEVMRQTGNKVAVTVELVPFGDRALNYIITNDEGESVKLECSSTSFERLAQMTALLAK